MKYRVERNDTRAPASTWFNTEQQATWLCADLNTGAYRRGTGGLYGIYDENGVRVP